MRLLYRSFFRLELNSYRNAWLMRVLWCWSPKLYWNKWRWSLLESVLWQEPNISFVLFSSHCEFTLHTCFWLSMLWWMLVWKSSFNHVSFKGASPHNVCLVFLGLYTLCIAKTALIARSKVCSSEFNRCAQTFSFLTENLFSEQW